jgi:hypothetical protein
MESILETKAATILEFLQGLHGSLLVTFAQTLHYPLAPHTHLHLLQEEIALRRAMEAVAVARSNLPPGGLIPEDYIFDALGPDGTPAKIKLSELFGPGHDSVG